MLQRQSEAAVHACTGKAGRGVGCRGVVRGHMSVFFALTPQAGALQGCSPTAARAWDPQKSDGRPGGGGAGRGGRAMVRRGCSPTAKRTAHRPQRRANCEGAPTAEGSWDWRGKKTRGQLRGCSPTAETSRVLLLNPQFPCCPRPDVHLDALPRAVIPLQLDVVDVPWPDGH